MADAAGSLMQVLLAKLDILQLVKIATDPSAAPDPKTLGMLKTAHRILSTPVIGDIAWSQAMEYAAKSNAEGFILPYLTATPVANLVPDHVAPLELKDGKEYFVAVVDSVISREHVDTMSDIIECPRCKFTFAKHN